MTPCAISYFHCFTSQQFQETRRETTFAAATINQGQGGHFSTLISFRVAPPISISLLEILYSNLFIVSSAITAGSAAAAGEMEKDLRHQLNVGVNRNPSFYPLVVESLGLWSSSSLEVLKDIARKTTLTSGQTISKALTNLHERLSVCLWKYNGRMLLDRLAVSHNSDLWDTLV